MNARLTPLALHSGTTGLPKGVCLTHFNLISNFLQMGDIDPPSEGISPLFSLILTRFLQPKADDVESAGPAVHLGLLPFFHSYGMMVMNAAILGPHPLVVVRKFELKAWHPSRARVLSRSDLVTMNRSFLRFCRSTR